MKKLLIALGFLLGLAGSAWATDCTVTSVTPGTGTCVGGLQTAIVGTNFGAGATVSVNSTLFTGITLTGTTLITCTSASITTGVYDVIVSYSSNEPGTLASGWTSTCASGTITSISPSTGTPVGSTSVTITGTSLCAGGTIKIGGTAGTSYSRISSTSASITNAAVLAGLYDVEYSEGGAGSTLSSGYTYKTTIVGGLDPDTRWIQLLNRVTSSTASKVISVEDYDLITLVFKCEYRSSGNGVFTVGFGADQTNFYTYDKLLDSSGADAPVSSITLSADGTDVVALSPEDAVKYIYVKVVVTTDGAYSAWAMVKRKIKNR